MAGIPQGASEKVTLLQTEKEQRQAQRRIRIAAYVKPTQENQEKPIFFSSQRAFI